MKNAYIPDQNDILWMDLEPIKGKEIGKYRPVLVLSEKYSNKTTRQLICCPISTSIRGHFLEVPVNNLDRPSVVISNVIRTISWKERNAKFITQAEDGVLKDVLQRIIPLIGADKLLLQSVDDSR